MTTSRRRVLFVVDAFPDAADPIDGVFLRDQAAALSRRADVGVVLPRTVSPRQWIARRGRPLRDRVYVAAPEGPYSAAGRLGEDDGFTVFVNESFVSTARATGRLVRARCRSLERAVRAFEQRFGRPDVIHAHGAAFAGETAVCVGRALDVPVVITEHYSFLPRLFAVYGDRLRRVYEAADVVCTPSHGQARRLAELGVARAVRCLPNAVDADTFVFRPIASPADGMWRLLCVARDHEVKDLPTLIEAAARLRGVWFELCIAGGGEYRRTRTLAAQRGLEGRVRFLGALTRGELAAAMHACHLVVSSSRTETFGMSLAEALCTGRPVVATDSGGPRDIVRPCDGRIVPVGDAAALADAIGDVLERYGEFDAQAVAASARERFGFDAFSDRTMAIYDDVCGGPSPAGGLRRERAGGRAIGDITTTVVIPTRDRPAALTACLESLRRQTVRPGEVLVADASADDSTRRLVESMGFPDGVAVRYVRCRRAGASAQRNVAIDRAGGEIIFFLDDDVECEPTFVEEVLKVFAGDVEGEIAGVSGTIVNQTLGTPSRLSRTFMHWMAGRALRRYGGRLIGPAWNLLPADAEDAVRAVEWLPGGCAAYRAAVLRRCRFNESFGEYSFAEDVDLSARIGRYGRLVNTGRARMFHRGIGSASHRQPRRLGYGQVVNRWTIARDVLGRAGWLDRLKLAALQAYFGAAELRGCLAGRANWRRMLPLWAGRVQGLVSVFCDVRRGREESAASCGYVIADVARESP